MKKIVQIIIIIFFFVIIGDKAYADTKWINNVLYGNLCRKGNVFSLRFEWKYWGVVGSKCNLLTIEGNIFGEGRITYE